VRKIKNGFTLIEIIIVIVLLGILAGIAYPKYLDLRDEAHIRKDELVISNWRVGVQMFFVKYKRFPNTREELESCLEGGLPNGWEIYADRDITFSDVLIRCDGLPSNSESYATWIYSSTDGSFIKSDSH